MFVDLVQITAADGVRLDGAFQQPANPPLRPLRADGMVLLHGTGSNFYSSALLESIAQRLVGLGMGVVRANTRGHDGLSHAITARGRRRAGAAFESFGECHMDVTAWIEFLTGRGFSRIGLLGHSLGASKGIYTAARHPHPAVTSLVAVSPPRLSHSYFRASRKREQFIDTYARAESLVAAGEPATLLDIGFPFPHVVSAAGYVEKYGPDERCNFLEWLKDLPCPALFTFGAIEVEREVAFEGLPAAVSEKKMATQLIDLTVIEAADHSYAGTFDVLEQRIETWLAG